MPHPLQMFYGNLSQLGKKSNSVIIQFLHRENMITSALLVYELIGVSFPPPGGFLQTYLIWKSIISETF